VTRGCSGKLGREKHFGLVMVDRLLGLEGGNACTLRLGVEGGSWDAFSLGSRHWDCAQTVSGARGTLTLAPL